MGTAALEKVSKGAAVRIGAVSYLNTKPLVYQLESLAPWAQLVFDVPSRLAEGLACGSLDVALIPSISCAGRPDYQIVSDACIACRGAVWSVKLLSRVPTSQIRTLALDEGSRTSAVLIQVLLWRRYGLRPNLLPLPLACDPTQIPADAILLIGDRAIHLPEDDFVEVWDLGEAWWAETRLPFVFAMWVARAESVMPQLAAALSAARNAGVAAVERIARDEAPGMGISFDACLRYLRDHLHFFLGPEERRALDLFYQWAEELELVPTGRRPTGLPRSIALGLSP